MLAWVCAIGMLIFALTGWVSVRRVPKAPGSRSPDSFTVDLPLTLGMALGFLGSFRDSDHPWIGAAGPVSIPIVAGAIGFGWVLVSSHPTIDRLRSSDALGVVISWGVLIAALFTGGLGLADGAAILLALASWSVVRSQQNPDAATEPPAKHRYTGAIWGCSVLGLVGMVLGLAPQAAWAIAFLGLLAMAPPRKGADESRDLGPLLGLMVVTPLAALATASAVGVLMLAIGAGEAAQRVGDRWILGFAQTLSARPVATLPGGFAPEMCLIGAALGVGICASKLPRGAHRLLGGVVALAGFGIALLALAS